MAAFPPKHLPDSFSYIISLIGVLALMAGIVIAGLIWRHWSDAQRSALANGYHLSSAGWSSEIEGETADLLGRMQVFLETMNAGRQTSGRPDDSQAESNITRIIQDIEDALYFSEGVFNSLQSSEKLFGDGTSAKALDRLLSVRRKINSSIASQELMTVKKFTVLLEWVRAFRLRADQLHRLHVAGYDQAIQVAEEEQRHENIFFGTVISASAIIGLVLVLAILMRIRRKEIELRTSREALSESEQRFQAVLDSSPWYMATMDLEDRFLLVSKKWSEVFGKDQKEVANKSIHEVLPRKISEKILSHHLEVISSKKMLLEEREIPTHEGPRTYLVTKFPVLDSTGEIKEICTLGADITDRKQAELAVCIAKEEADKANNTKSEFLSSMSHEIRTPLNGIIGMASVLQRNDTLSPKEAQQVDLILECGQSLLGLLNDILDLSKIEAGQLEHEEVNFDLLQLIDKLAPVWRTLAQAKGNEVIVAMSQIDEPLLSGAVSRLQQVLTNIVGNAIKFTCEGQVTITARQKVAANGSVECTFKIADTGIGIAPENLDTIFDKFKQADSSTTRQYGGTGLGLAISKSLIETMDGEINVESRPGEGSTFTFSIFMQPAAETSQFIANDKPATECQSLSPAPLSILAAEDNRANQLVLRTILEQVYGDTGLKLDIVDSGLALMGSLMRADYDLILMDIQMPEMGGVEATERIRNLPGSISSIPIIAVTANTMKGDREKYLAAGMDDYIEKPLNVAEMIATIELYRPTKVVEASNLTA